MTPRENLYNYLKDRNYEWFPNSGDKLVFEPEELHDFKARGMINQQEPFDPANYGGEGWFGLKWEYVPQVRGSITVGRIMDDLDEWKEKLVWPDLDAVDWDAIKERNKDYLNTDKMIATTIYTGWFERLISFVEFEDAAVALIDPDYEDTVNELFTRLTDLYIDFATRMHEHFGVEYFLVHDDWGSQRAPLISPETQREMILPHVKRLVDHIHGMDCFYEQHSCGLIHDTIPNIIESGADSWVGQDCCDKEMLVNKYWKEFKFGVMVPNKPGATPEESVEFVKSYYDKYKGKRVWFSVSRLMPKENGKAVAEFLRSVK
ncbi:MAG: hypothetical protein II164_03325 [Firmicutes bacterium]|nr:hypothetical protein [Bacillota bacterium]